MIDLMVNGFSVFSYNKKKDSYYSNQAKTLLTKNKRKHKFLSWFDVFFELKYCLDCRLLYYFPSQKSKSQLFALNKYQTILNSSKNDL